MPYNSLIHGKTVTMHTPEIWKRFEELRMTCVFDLCQSRSNWILKMIGILSTPV
ncbi:MAG TPA: hypothetical protein VKM55_29190 [Candidatus Lokiarchaeia archaeon]|nr:hypothetical protein [Candidatus Lokiarchaeia archaeon]